MAWQPVMPFQEDAERKRARDSPGPHAQAMVREEETNWPIKNKATAAHHSSIGKLGRRGT